MIFKLLKSIFNANIFEPQSLSETIPVIEADKAIISKIVLDWDKRFPISGDEIACKRFSEIINADLFNGERAENNSIELLELVVSGRVNFDDISEFQRKAQGKYKLVNRKAIITDHSFDEVPYGTLSSLLKNNPKTCLIAYRVAVNGYMMKKYHVTRYLASGISEGTITASLNSARRCLGDNERVITLDPENLPVPHFLGCSCTIRPIIKF